VFFHDTKQSTLHVVVGLEGEVGINFSWAFDS
jgi:hypothetical protein